MKITSLKTSVSQLLRRASGQELSFFGLIGAATGLASDIYEPLLPSTMLWIVVSIAGFVICVWFFQNALEKQDDTKERIFGDGAILFGGSIPIVALLALVQFFFPAAEDDNESAIARMFPAVENLQVSIGALDERLTSIDEGIAGLNEGVSEINEGVSEIREDVKGLKRETSDNPRKELANLGVQWNGDSFLQAIAEGDIQTVRLFVDGGIRPETARNQGRPLPIMLGKNTFNSDDMVSEVLRTGVDIDYSFPSGNFSGPKTYTMLSWAIQVDNINLVKALIKNGADVNKEVEASAAVGIGAVYYPLPLAVSRGSFEIANLLLDQGADPSTDNYASYRALNLAWERLTAKGKESAAKQLLQRLEPPGSAKEKVDAELRLIAIKRELTDVALESMRSVSQSEKQRYDARYDELQVERAALVKKYGLADN